MRGVCHPDAVTVCAHVAAHPASQLVGYGVLVAIMLVMVAIPGVLLVRAYPVADDGR